MGLLEIIVESIAAYPMEKLRLLGQTKSYGILAIYIKLSSRRCQLTVKVLAYPIVNYIVIISGITLKVRNSKDVSLTLMLFAIFLDMDVSTGTMHLESFIIKVYKAN